MHIFKSQKCRISAILGPAAFLRHANAAFLRFFLTGHKVEASLSRLLAYLNVKEPSSPKSKRKSAIIRQNNISNTRLSMITEELKEKYGEFGSVGELKKNQSTKLLVKCQKKPLHGIYARNITKSKISMPDSSLWLMKSKISPQEESSLALLQDRNLFWLNKKQCHLCPDKKRTVDYVATKCHIRVSVDY